MSRIGQLLKGLLPGGVEFRPVGEAFAVVQTGRGIQRSEYALGTKYPIVDQGLGLIAGYTDDPTLLVTPGDYVVFGDHTRAVKWVNFEFAPGADGTKVLRAADGLLPKFGYYALANISIPSRGYNRHWTILRDERIPVPPVEVQEEVIGILDTFTELEAELEAELESRRRQYEHYRDALIVSAYRAGVSRIALADLGQFIRGRRFTWKDVVEGDGIPAIHYSEIYTHYGVATSAALSHVRRELAPTLRMAMPGDVVLAAVGETVEDLGKAVAWVGSSPVAIHDDTFLFRSNLDPKFVAYCTQTADFQAQKGRHVARAKVKRISGTGLGNITIPVPTLAEQQRIVASLDAFDVLVNDLNVGLPAELAARRRQYEYYRDKLLTFEEVA